MSNSVDNEISLSCIKRSVLTDVTDDEISVDETRDYVLTKHVIIEVTR